MCYDISFQVHLKEITDYFPELVIDTQISIDFEHDHIMGHAFAEHPIIYRNRQDKKLHLESMEWGVIPYYIKDEKSYAGQRANMLNTRAERILDDPKSYWYKIKDRRCLVPVTGIYEHRAVKGWLKKVPYYIALKNQEMFFLPGLYSVAELPDMETGELIKRWTYSIITREANEKMAQIHNAGKDKARMVLFLPLEMSRLWLSETLAEKEYRDILNFCMPADELKYWPVFTIRSPKMRPDGKLKTEPWEWEKLPELGTANPD